LYHPFGALVFVIVFLAVVVAFINKTSEWQTDLNEPNQLQQQFVAPQ